MAQVKFDSENVKAGQDQKFSLSAKGEAKLTEESVVEPVPQLGFESLAALEKFMQEPVEVLVTAPMNEGEVGYIQLWVNGVHQLVMCEQPQTIARKYLEVLARSRQVHVSAYGYRDGIEAKNVVKRHSSSRYNFQVLNDPSGSKGMSWLKSIMAEN